MNVYFDNAATTPLRPEVVACLVEQLSVFGNPSSVHHFGRAAKSSIEQARRKIAQILAAQPAEIIFTSGATEGTNMIIRQSVERLGVRHIISSPMEHHATLACLEHVRTHSAVQVHFVKITSEGLVDMTHLHELISSIEGKKMVSLMHVNNETGAILPMAQVAELCKAHGAYFHTDAVQSVGHLPIDLSELPLDFLSASAHKFHGPKGVGFVFVRRRIKLGAFVVGGEQERGFRAGTEATHQILAMQRALEISKDRFLEEQKQLMALKQYLISSLKKAIPLIAFNGCSDDFQRSTPHILNVRLPLPSEQTSVVLLWLEMQGIALSRGSACQSGSVGHSHVLGAFLPEQELVRPNLRISISVFNTCDEVDYLVEKLRLFCEQS